MKRTTINVTHRRQCFVFISGSQTVDAGVNYLLTAKFWSYSIHLFEFLLAFWVGFFFRFYYFFWSISNFQVSLDIVTVSHHNSSVFSVKRFSGQLCRMISTTFCCLDSLVQRFWQHFVAFVIKLVQDLKYSYVKWLHRPIFLGVFLRHMECILSVVSPISCNMCLPFLCILTTLHLDRINLILGCSIVNS